MAGMIAVRGRTGAPGQAGDPSRVDLAPTLHQAEGEDRTAEGEQSQEDPA